MILQTLTAIPLVRLDEFLVSEEWHDLMQYTQDRCYDFRATSIVGPSGKNQIDTTYRRSRVLFDLGEFREIFIERIFAYLPLVLAGLNFPSFAVSDVEVQLTATGDGEFFRKHNDNGTDALSSRLITFVYFFYREPRSFIGGELYVFDTELGDGQYDTRVPYTMITPTQNQILFFISEYLHEVFPVQCMSTDFMDSRFTVNGWLHR